MATKLPPNSSENHERISELDVVAANRDLESGVMKGTQGVILELLGDGKAFLVEFFQEDDPLSGWVETVGPDDVDVICKYGSEDIASIDPQTNGKVDSGN